jgi:hypothetical protein
MGFKRIASARWEGDLIAGKGSMSTPQSGLFTDQNYSFKTRFGACRLLQHGAVCGARQSRIHAGPD